MNTKIQVLNSVDLENISGGMNRNLANALEEFNPFGDSEGPSGSCGDSSRNSENLKGFSDFLKGLAWPFGISYEENSVFDFYTDNIGNFSPAFCKNISTSGRAGFLTAFAIFTGAIIGTYEGIKWAVKKIF